MTDLAQDVWRNLFWIVFWNEFEKKSEKDNTRITLKILWCNFSYIMLTQKFSINVKEVHTSIYSTVIKPVTSKNLRIH